MDFERWATLYWPHPTPEGLLSEQGQLRGLIRKFLELSPLDRQRCSITVGEFTYRRAEIETLSRRPDFSDPMKRRRGPGIRVRTPGAGAPESAV